MYRTTQVVAGCLAAAALSGCMPPAQRFAGAVAQARAANRPVLIYYYNYDPMNKLNDTVSVSIGFINTGDKTITKASFKLIGFTTSGMPDGDSLQDAQVILSTQHPVKPGKSGRIDTNGDPWGMSARCAALVAMQIQFDDGSVLTVRGPHFVDYWTPNMSHWCNPYFTPEGLKLRRQSASPAPTGLRH